MYCGHGAYLYSNSGIFIKRIETINFNQSDNFFFEIPKCSSGKSSLNSNAYKCNRCLYKHTEYNKY